ncbi:hypothetical protein UFOVP1302_32 [uncultured Caudovirales phage]|uniref:Terminase small subunit n=1 Tax=uncultured Caudovirales phage TaxID=2100421 RepID=A0A6J5RE30_9CAUD|nr:hypothetical protein UFOVP895_35 [uncultured Caudovirales phage]CAB4181625.1 hypothetical protein UFOVP1070_52 [uncultured Caudovirales phage]CAB4195760.1 hypothetical protein UFOVP1302_32 [uncultured Caudovirales phage]CAB4211966.1 hypothetical protein UFOVP1416_80 [uncultured Caudovirales phage]
MSDINGGETNQRKRKVSSKPKLRLVGAVDAAIVSLARGQGKDLHGLTAKQEAFAQGVGTRGETLSTAYRAAYDAANMSTPAIHVAACRLMASPTVGLRVNQLVKQRQAKSSYDSSRIMTHVVERLHAESIDTDNPPSARVRALELLGRLGAVQAFAPITADTVGDAAPADLAASLEARLRAMLSKAG